MQNPLHNRKINLILFSENTQKFAKICILYNISICSKFLNFLYKHNTIPSYSDKWLKRLNMGFRRSLVQFKEYMLAKPYESFINQKLEKYVNFSHLCRKMATS